MRLFALCPNPSIDLSAEAEQVYPHRKVRTGEQRLEPGGGGINVARVLAELGTPAELLWLSGGASGALLDGAIARSGLHGTRVAIGGETRIAFNVHERGSGADYRFVPEGPTLGVDESAAWSAAVHALAFGAGDLLVASGSLPPGMPTEAHAALADLAASRGARCVLDTSGASLAAALAPGASAPFLVKPSLGELEGLVGRRLDQRAAERAACELVAAGRAAHIAVSMGAHGAFLASAERVTRLPSLRVRTRSAVGAGDSFLGAMLWRLALGERIEAAFAFGVAAGAAAVMTGGTELCRRTDVLALHAALGAAEVVAAGSARA